MVAFGERLAAFIKPGMVLALQGDLGSGKTTLTSGLARGLGISEPLLSPTFTLIREYEGRLPLFHIDAYRLQDGDDLIGLGAEDYLYGPGVTVVEWSDRVSEALPTEAWRINIEILPDGRRRLQLEAAELERELP